MVIKREFSISLIQSRNERQIWLTFNRHGSFTGAFVGVAASDMNGTEKVAQFDYFTYTPIHHSSDRYDV